MNRRRGAQTPPHTSAPTSDSQLDAGPLAMPPAAISVLAKLLHGDEAPAASDELLRAALDLSPDAVIIVGPDGRIALVNRQTELLFGYTADDLLGQVIERLIPARFHPAHRRHRHGYLTDPRTRPMGTALRLFGARKDGSEFPVEVSLNPVTVDASLFVIGTIRDVTERKALEDALLESERRIHQETVTHLALLQTILDEIPLATYLVRGSDARLVLANRAVKDIWGGDWPIGQPFEAFLADVGTRILGMSGQPLVGDELATLRALRSHATVRSQQEVLRRRDGTTLPVLVNAIPLDPRVIGHANTLTGTAAVPSAPDEAPEPVALVVHADVTPLREAERLKDEFVAMAAHELRNPMGTLSVYGSMLRRADSGDTSPLEDLIAWRTEALDGIDQMTRQLVSLTDDLLDVTRLQVGGFPMRPEPHDLGALVRRVVGRVQKTTDRHHIVLSGAENPIVVQIDVKRTEQVVTNLLNNAVKYSPTAGDILLALTVQHEDGIEAVELTVRDFGMGIPFEDQAQIFGRFARGANARAAQIEGTGLGLYLCRELIERQGGRIWFESSEGVGTTFHVRLPMLPLPPE